MGRLGRRIQPHLARDALVGDFEVLFELLLDEPGVVEIFEAGEEVGLRVVVLESNDVVGAVNGVFAAGLLSVQKSCLISAVKTLQLPVQGRGPWRTESSPPETRITVLLRKVQSTA